MTKKNTPTTDITVIYNNVLNILREAKRNSYRAINTQMVKAYWEIGKTIVEEEQKGKERAEYGDYLVKKLSQRLTKDVGKGFSESNIWFMRQFYLVFPILDAVRGELTWTHYRLLIRVKNKNAREYYLNESIEQNWSTRALERQIHTLYYERILASKNDKDVRKEAEEKTKPLAERPEEFIKDPYIMEFLGISDSTKHIEKDIEQGLIDKLQQFLLELGKGFSFVSRQKRISFSKSYFRIDLVFYNYILKCFVLIDLKIGTLTHQDIGQMQMYVNYYDRELLNKGDNKTIGLVLCADKDDAVVKYTLPKGTKNIFASKYHTCLPTEEELKRELEREKELIEREKRLAQNNKQESHE
ncbi:MAG: PDDEXK nuclease domain-containing protein [Bacteroidota bacterium]